METIHSLDKKIQSNPVSEAFITEKHFAKEKLDVLYKDKAIGAQIRSRVRWMEEGERSTSYFLGVENYKQSYNLTIFQGLPVRCSLTAILLSIC